MMEHLHNFKNKLFFFYIYFNFIYFVRYLAHMYMAEAQVYLDRIADAIRNLNAENVNDISVNLPDDKSEQG